MGKILVVDDETTVLTSFERILSRLGHRVILASQAEAGFALLASEKPDLVIMDIRLPGMNGLEAFRQMTVSNPQLPIIIMTGYGTTESAIEAMKLGAFDYQVKPFDPDEMLRIIDRALEGLRLMQRPVHLNPETVENAEDALVGQSVGMRDVYKMIGRVASTDATVLIRGETGTGKELVARAIYQHSQHNRAPLLVVNCAAIPEMLLESELFGYERGAFTGAVSRRIGKFEQASGSTIFLDEIGDIPLGIQVKILRMLQERTFERLGGNETIRADVRIIAATNRNLEQAIEEGAFREDLYHRLNVVTIEIPPLRDRLEDVPRLVDYFLACFSRQMKMKKPILSDEAMEVLQNHLWPGNVRELEHCLQRVMIYTRGYPIQVADICWALEQSGEDVPTDMGKQIENQLQEHIREYLRTYSGQAAHVELLERVDGLVVREALRLTSGNQTHAARVLGLTRPTLQAKMQKYGIRRDVGLQEKGESSS